jgi:hypothetical protein
MAKPLLSFPLLFQSHYNIHSVDEEFIQYVNSQTWEEETIWKIHGRKILNKYEGSVVTTRPQLTDGGGDLQIWSVPVGSNMLNRPAVANHSDLTDH